MRYAVYFTPAHDHALTAAAAAWLGRDAFTGRDAGGGPQLPDIAPSLARYHLAAPRRYGFHGTIVAPFRPAEGVGEADLVAALEDFCAAETVFAVPLAIERLSNFLALMPTGPSERLDAMAARAVQHFDALRAPLGEDDIARRRPELLTAQQRKLLERWGYPYVMEEFRFHMTLSGALDAAAMPVVEKAARDWFAGFLARPLDFDGLAVFVEPEPGSPFMVLKRIEFEEKSD